MEKIEKTVSLPVMFLIAGTRAALGGGVGLLLGNHLNSDQRKAAGWALAAFGALSTFPLWLEVFGKKPEESLDYDATEAAIPMRH